MTQRRDPVVAVIDYFETTELALARQTLAIATAIIRRRTPKAVAKPTAVKKSAARTTAPVVATVGE